MRHSLPPATKLAAIEALRKQGVSTMRAERAYAKWAVEAPPIPCVEEAKGKELGLYTRCSCEGCVERLAAMLFGLAEQLARRDHLP